LERGIRFADVVQQPRKRGKPDNTSVSTEA
jgi:hypothetical protein